MSVPEAFGVGAVSSTSSRFGSDFLQACVRNMPLDVIALKLNVALCVKNSSFSSSGSGALAKKSFPVVMFTERYFSWLLRWTRNPHIEFGAGIMWTTAFCACALVEFSAEPETFPECEMLACGFPKMATPSFSCRKRPGSAWLLNMRGLCSFSDNCSPRLCTWTWTRPEQKEESSFAVKVRNRLYIWYMSHFHRHSRWLYIQQQSSSSSSNRFIEHDVSNKWICLESLDVYPKKARVSGWKRRVQ